MFDKEIQEILIRRRNKIILPEPDYYDTLTRKVATLNKNLEMGFGYILSSKVNRVLTRCNVDDVKDFYNILVSALKKMLPQKKYKPMYKNFPSQVMDMDEAELYFNAIMHYTGDLVGERIMPEYEEQERNPLFEDTNVVVLEEGNINDLVDIFTNLILSRTSISIQDKEDINKLLDFGVTSIIQSPYQIPHKEVLAFLCKSLIERNLPVSKEWFKNATDILRLAVALSDGDVSLATKTKFRNFKRKERREILRLLNNLDNQNILSDMARHTNQWIRLGEKLHPGDYQQKYNKAFYYFDMLRNHKVQTTNGVIESAIKSGDLDNALNELKRVPGEFVRKLDRLFRDTHQTEHDKIINSLIDVLERVSTPVLLQALKHFQTRMKNPYRVFLPKGNVQKAYVTDNCLRPLPIETSWAVLRQIYRFLMNRFGKLDSLGKAYLDPKLDQYTVPFSQRSASKTLKTISRGSKIDLTQDNLRFFISWKQPMGERTDIDLSAVFFDANWNNIGHLSYTNLKNQYAVHSGDLVSAPKGASEYIDLDIGTAVECGVRYVMAQVFCFTQKPFCDLPECDFGWMERDDLTAGEIYECKTVKNDFDLSANSRIALPVIIDLISDKIIWCDISLKHQIGRARGNRWGINVGGNNVESNIDTITAMGLAMTNLEKTTIHDLLELHCFARAEEMVDNPEEADTIFSEDEGTHYQLDVLMNEFLT